MKIKWFGHASFRIETSGKVIYIDPFVIPENPEPADIVLVTHEHFDHCDPKNIKVISSGKTQIIATKKAAEKLSGNIKIAKPGDSFEIAGIRIRAVDAYNHAKPFHHKGEYVGFVIEAEGKRIYHAGDTDFIPEMKSLQSLTVAMVPIGGTYTMSMDEAVEAVAAMKPKIAIPMHYNHLDGLKADAEKWKRKVEATTSTKVEILEGGRRELEI